MAEAEFDKWLKDSLIKLDTDDEIFSSYIKGILESDETRDEKLEALNGIISEITPDNIEELCSDIIKRWEAISSTPAAQEENAAESLDHRLAKLMEQQASCAPLAAQRRTNTEQQELKKSILAQYAEVSGDEDEEESDDEPPKGAAGGGLMKKNTNAAAVEEEIKQKREQSKEEHRLKKNKDKEEREKQKAKADERKEKEKKRTQKGERRR